MQKESLCKGPGAGVSSVDEEQGCYMVGKE